MPLTPGGSFAAPTTSLSLHAPVFNMQQPPPPKRTSDPKGAPPKRSSLSKSCVAPNHQPSGLTKSASGSSTSSSSNGTTASSSAQPNTTNGVSGGSSKGQIHVKLIQARGLNVHSSKARPYVVVQFEQNEFVSRDPTDESDKEVKGIATNLSRQSSSTTLAQSSALSALGAISNRVNARPNGHGSTVPNGKEGSSKDPSPSSSVGSHKSGLGPLATGVFGLRISPNNPVWKHEVSL